MERKWWVRALYWVLPAVLPIGFLIAWFVSSPSKTPASSKTSTMDFSAKMLDGSSFQALSHRGKWLLVEFWSTTCGSCLKMMPTMEKFYRETQGSSLDVIAVEIRAEEEEAKNIQQEMSLSLPIALDVFRVSQEYGITVVPTLLFVDPQGQIRARAEGEHSLAQLYEMAQPAGLSFKR